MATHPDLAAEQAYIDKAYDSLERARQSATRLRSMVEVGRGGTEQARWEREMIEENIAARLDYLNLGDASLVFGRIDQARAEGGDSFYIGRIAVADESQEPLVVDWRAPVAEPFYRATGRAPMGLVRRRHFATRARKLLGIEDELFGEGADLLGGELAISDDGQEVRGHGSLIAALEEARTGRLTDIVATIQGEQDEVIRSPLPGVLVVQGGPGTGKTVVALHRAAYLLYTYRFPLEGQGVLVVGPNRLFLGYIERVLPSLGEAGVELAVLADLVDHVEVEGRDRGLTARTKGDARMSTVLARAVRDRERPLRRDLRVPYGVQTLVVPARRTADIVADARRRFRLHNAGRRFVESQLYLAMAEVSRVPATPDEVRERTRLLPVVREALERMWPVLTPAQLLHDLYGSRALIDLAGRKHLSDDERAALVRPRSADVGAVLWTHDDVPLLDEARALLGPTRRKRTNGSDPDEIRTYGHIVVDEAQDLSPMQLRMLDRRSLNGSMTVVGDIAQSTGVWAHRDWDEVLEHLPQKRPAQRAELSIGYRIPGPTMDLAAKVLAVAAPELQPPNSVRQTGDEPRLLAVDSTDGPEALADAVAAVAAEERDTVDPGTVAIIAPNTLVDDVAVALDRAGIDFGRASRTGLQSRITLVPVNLVKGLELDAAVVVEPAAIVDEEAQGMRALYVALTRATRRLAVVHARELPGPLR
ncbi:MAG TPA: ATP-binding domain-containing protein [Acidimicrobiales bacterium]|nr:ATP-binding domain-containing protein [Acidimicrobiales bacterium]